MFDERAIPSIKWIFSNVLIILTWVSIIAFVLISLNTSNFVIAPINPKRGSLSASKLLKYPNPAAHV